MHGSLYQSGIPDLWGCHLRYGERWIEVKLPGMRGSKWTNAQKETFPRMAKNGGRIWVLTGATDEEYFKLFSEPNLPEYMDIDAYWEEYSKDLKLPV